MTVSLFLVKTVQLTKYNINIYSSNQSLNLDDEIATILSQLEASKYPKEIISQLLIIYGVNLIEILDKNDEIILVSSNILPDDIIYE